MASTNIYVYADWSGLNGPVLIGTRNHGFLLGENGWKLSPAFDVNPVPTGTGLTLNITDEDNSLNTELAMEIAEIFRLETATSKETIDNIKKNIKNWRKIATSYGLSRREQDLMSASFGH